MAHLNRSWTVVRATWLTRRPYAHAWLVAAWCMILLITGSLLYWFNFYGANSWMPASGAAVFQKNEYWRLWTALFAHADLGHLISNSILFFIFGYFLSGYFGLIIFPSLAFLTGGLTNFIVLLSYNPEVRLVGVSGVVYWMGGMWLGMYLLLDIQRTWTQRILRSLGVALAVFMPTTAFDPQISYSAHGWGFILGVLCALVFYFLQRRLFQAAIVKEIMTEEEEVIPPQPEVGSLQSFQNV